MFVFCLRVRVFEQRIVEGKNAWRENDEQLEICALSTYPTKIHRLSRLANPPHQSGHTILIFSNFQQFLKKNFWQKSKKKGVSGKVFRYGAMVNMAFDKLFLMKTKSFLTESKSLLFAVGQERKLKWFEKWLFECVLFTFFSLKSIYQIFISN